MGGGFSLDGVHPSNIVYAILANVFLQALNQHYGSGFPLVGAVALNVIAANDPYLDRNGNGVVTGRPLAGLLETLGPLVGLSGDNESATSLDRRSSAVDAQQFLTAYRGLTGGPAMADPTAAASSALRHMLGIDVLLSRKQ